MLTNAKCTVIRGDDEGSYSAVYQSECMWQETEAYQVKKYGAENADKVTVYIPNVDADVQKGDYIVQGEVNINLDKIIESAFTVMSVTRYKYGSPINRHVRVGAR